MGRTIYRKLTCNISSLRFIVVLCTLLVSCSLSYADIRVTCAFSENSEAVISELSLHDECQKCFKESDVKPVFQDMFESFNWCKKFNITIYNNISFSDAYFMKVTSDLNQGAHNSIHHIYLDSTGGFVEAATSIGDSVFALGSSVFVNNNCYSSCIFILVSGKIRFFIPSEIGVHRISVDNLPSGIDPSGDGLDEYLSRTYLKIRQHLMKNGVSDALFQMMWSTPSAQIRTLTDDEAQESGLGLINTRFAEALRYKVSAKFGDDGVAALGEILTEINTCWKTLSCSNEELDQLLRALKQAEDAVK